jgi:hypothetical protein
LIEGQVALTERRCGDALKFELIDVQRLIVGDGGVDGSVSDM